MPSLSISEALHIALRLMRSDALAEASAMLGKILQARPDHLWAHAVAARDSGGQVLSLDIDNCSNLDLPETLRPLWSFVQSDDIGFGRDKFPAWCAEQGLAPAIDVLFIDSSHLYDHTREEIAVWFPYLRPGATVMCHDTNIAGVSRRDDGSLLGCWDNDRGVIRAIEDHLGLSLNEKTGFAGMAKGWLFQHWPNCAGLMVLRAPAA